MQTPIPDELYDLVLADSDRHVLGLGIGYVSGAHEIDLAWSYNWLRSRRIDGHPNPAMDGRHTYRADLAGLTYRYRY